jgi:hypothetical protein
MVLESNWVGLHRFVIRQNTISSAGPLHNSYPSLINLQVKVTKSVEITVCSSQKRSVILNHSPSFVAALVLAKDRLDDNVFYALCGGQLPVDRSLGVILSAIEALQNSKLLEQLTLMVGLGEG